MHPRKQANVTFMSSCLSASHANCGARSARARSRSRTRRRRRSLRARYRGGSSWRLGHDPLGMVPSLMIFSLVLSVPGSHHDGSANLATARRTDDPEADTPPALADTGRPRTHPWLDGWASARVIRDGPSYYSASTRCWNSTGYEASDYPRQRTERLDRVTSAAPPPNLLRDAARSTSRARYARLWSSALAGIVCTRVTTA
jgi:hypothetical protein